MRATKCENGQWGGCKPWRSRFSSQQRPKNTRWAELPVTNSGQGSK